METRGGDMTEVAQVNRDEKELCCDFKPLEWTQWVPWWR